MRDRFLQAMRATASTVSVVTTDGTGGRAGSTISAMSSVSADLEQPVLLICVNKLNSAADVICRNEVFCVNVLSEDQQRIAEIFASRSPATISDKFSCTRWSSSATGAPRMSDALVIFDCRLTNRLIVGSHHVLFGAVEDISLGKEGRPLLYSNRLYGGFMPCDGPNVSHAPLLQKASASAR